MKSWQLIAGVGDALQVRQKQVGKHLSGEGEEGEGKGTQPLLEMEGDPEPLAGVPAWGGGRWGPGKQVGMFGCCWCSAAGSGCPSRAPWRWCEWGERDRGAGRDTGTGVFGCSCPAVCRVSAARADCGAVLCVHVILVRVCIYGCVYVSACAQRGSVCVSGYMNVCDAYRK